MNLWDILILLTIAGILVIAVLSARKRKLSGKNHCGSCCQSCGLCREKPDCPQ